MNVIQHRKFANAYKRLHQREKVLLEDAIEHVLANPTDGEMKTGDLAGVRVHKFKVHNQLKLLAYTHTNDTLSLLYYGTHENFYRG